MCRDNIVISWGFFFSLFSFSKLHSRNRKFLLEEQNEALFNFHFCYLLNFIVHRVLPVFPSCFSPPLSFPSTSIGTALVEVLRLCVPTIATESKVVSRTELHPAVWPQFWPLPAAWPRAKYLPFPGTVALLPVWRWLYPPRKGFVRIGESQGALSIRALIVNRFWRALWPPDSVPKPFLWLSVTHKARAAGVQRSGYSSPIYSKTLTSHCPSQPSSSDRLVYLLCFK